MLSLYLYLFLLSYDSQYCDVHYLIYIFLTIFHSILYFNILEIHQFLIVHLLNDTYNTSNQLIFIEFYHLLILLTTPGIQVGATLKARA